jgi:hypothetical protein
MSIPIIGEVIKAVVSPILGIIDKLVPDKDQANQLKAEITNALLTFDTKKLEKSADIIIAEANGESWIQRNWRPLVMLTFAGLIVAHWLGFTPENLPPEQVMELLNIVKIGLAGYVVGRSAEKVAKNWKPNG